MMMAMVDMIMMVVINHNVHDILVSPQLERLEEVFMEQRYPDIYRREEIAVQLDLKEEVVRVR